jgi:hypothetical protein
MAKHGRFDSHVQDFGSAPALHASALDELASVFQRPASTPCNLCISLLESIIARPTQRANMSWRNQAGSTGSNNIPLGTRRRGGDSNGTPDFAPPPNEGKRGRSPEPVSKEPELNPDGTKKRRKRNRWGDAADNKAAGLMNLPTAITAPMTAEQLDAYVTHLRIEEISQKLRINDVVPADGDR